MALNAYNDDDALNVYADTVAEFAMYRDGAYPYMGLAAEWAEYEEKVVTDAPISERKAELGDVFWMACMIARDLGWQPGDCLQAYKAAVKTAPKASFCMGRLLSAKAKQMRGDQQPPIITKELVGGVLAHLIGVTRRCEYGLSAVLQINIGKLIDRAKRGVIKGNGDSR